MLPNLVAIANKVTRLIMEKDEEQQEQKKNYTSSEVITTLGIQKVVEGQVYIKKMF